MNLDPNLDISRPSALLRPRLSVLEVRGADAAKILGNLTTNQINDATESRAVETFVTNLKGKTIGHVLALERDNGFLLIGPPGQSEAIRQHVDRYTIREDAEADDAAGRWDVWVLHESRLPSNQIESLNAHPSPVRTVRVDWLGPHTHLWITASKSNDPARLEPPTAWSAITENETAFHDRRTRWGYPWFGIDFTDANLPQEVDRDATAISFTKGC